MVDQVGVHLADIGLFKRVLYDGLSASTDIKRNHGQCIVHRHDSLRHSDYSVFIAQRLVKGTA